MLKAKQPLRIAIFLSSLGAGGAERVAVQLAGWMKDRGHEVLLLTLDDKAGDFYEIPSGVTRVALSLQQESQGFISAFRNNISRLVGVRLAVRQARADAVVSFGSTNNVLMLIALMGVRRRKIISERSDPMRDPLTKPWRLLRSVTYGWASLNVTQSNYAAEWSRSRFPSLPCITIGNTGGVGTNSGSQELARKVVEEGTLIRLICVGRLTREKGVDILLEAYAQARRNFGNKADLTIIGDGNDSAVLTERAAALGLGSSIKFLGKVRDVERHYRASDIFVLPSRWEGFPNAMIEAMRVGLPVIAARCRGGVEDILGDVPNRYALEFEPEDITTLARQMLRLVNDAELRHKLAAAAKMRFTEYLPERISAKWAAAVEQ